MANGFDTRCRQHDTRLGSRRIFAPQFKLQVLDSYRNDFDCRGNQRATARKYGIHRRQIQKWLQAERTLRGAVLVQPGRDLNPLAPVDLSVRRGTPTPPPSPPPVVAAAWDLSKKLGYELEAPAPPAPPPQQPQQPRSYKLFRPFLPEDNFQEVDMSSLSPPRFDCDVRLPRELDRRRLEPQAS